MIHSKFHSALVVNCSRTNDILTEREFVWPIQRALPLPSKAILLSKLNEKTIKDFDVIVFSGCQLKDNDYIKKIPKLKWLTEISKPILGICAGQHILGMVYGAKLSILKNPAIGVHPVKIVKQHDLVHSFFKKFNVYSLHGNQISLPKNFECIATSKFAKNEIMVHKTKPIVGVSFHPEVLNKPFFHAFLGWVKKFT